MYSFPEVVIKTLILLKRCPKNQTPFCLNDIIFSQNNIHWKDERWFKCLPYKTNRKNAE